ncbi:ATP-binding cassette domain-containing protein [Lentzea sp. NPDC004782]|uniref:ABC transporter ATP-binding protein n=1 Tax=Lentzea sp. NPDC004782 TaxID=3154458 RepID=UPI0033AC02FF
MTFALDDVTVRRGSAQVLDEVSARIPTGSCTGVIGSSGAGKTTLLRLLNRLEEPDKGRILLDGVPLPELDVLALRRRVGLVPQRPVLLADHVADELRIGRHDLPESRVDELLTTVGLPTSFAARPTSELSGGEAQRVCIARALAVEPEVLLLDEPTSALDEVSAVLIADLARAHATGGGTVVLVSHNLDLVRDVADEVLLLEHGRLVTPGQAR